MRSLQIISDFNAGPVGGYLTSKLVDVDCAVSVAPFGQVYQCLGLTDSDADFSFVWTRAEGVIPSFRRVLDMASVSEEEVLADVDVFADALVRHVGEGRYCFATSWVAPEAHR